MTSNGTKSYFRFLLFVIAIGFVGCLQNDINPYKKIDNAIEGFDYQLAKDLIQKQKIANREESDDLKLQFYRFKFSVFKGELNHATTLLDSLKAHSVYKPMIKKMGNEFIDLEAQMLFKKRAFNQAKEKYNSLLGSAVITKNLDKELYAYLMMERCNIYQNRALLIDSITLKRINTINRPSLSGLLHLNKASYYNFISQPDSAIAHSEKALKHFNQINDIKGERDSFIAISLSYSAKGEKIKAYNALRQGIKKAEIVGDLLSNYSLYINLGYIYSTYNKYDEAEDAFNKAFTPEIINNITDANYFYETTFGQLAYKKENYNKALSHYQNALQILGDNANLKNDELFVLERLGTINKKLNNLDTSLSYYNKVIKANKKNITYFVALNGISDIQNQLHKNTQQAIQNSKLAYNYGNKNNSLRLKRLASKTLWEGNKLLRNYKDAIYYSEIYHTLIEDAYDKEMLADLNFLENDFLNKEELLLNKIKLQEQELLTDRKINTINRLIFGFIILMFAIGVFAFIKTKQANKKLRSANLKLEKSTHEIETMLLQNNQLENRIIDMKNSLSKDLHDNFGNRLVGLITTYDIIKSFNDKNEYIDSTYTKFSKRLEDNLMILIQDVKDLIWINNTKNNSLLDLVYRLEQFSQNLLNENNIAINITYQITKKTNYKLSDIWKKELLFILKEAITNAVKHSHGNSIDINFVTHEPFGIKITCKDDGIGFNEKLLTRKSGLVNIRKRSETINCKLTITSNDGVTIYIEGDYKE